ncbi:NlpC/P60 family protein [Paenibacillus spiritus]|uniref:NlpC/P60 family protein n=1 Tax=Paenibacillus spiritus TaxID=2496557 RepID=A0A5J5G4X4_9BACL|nr:MULTISPECIES: C40 family peptidase [Paenibacillus]KAA9002099.1 NlpC/P60 family protein [Paenibacillus spiritus]
MHKWIRQAAAALWAVGIAAGAGSAAGAATVHAAGNSASPATLAGRSAVIVSTVNLRDQPSLEGRFLTYLKQGSTVTILDQPTDYFYKIRTPEGRIGYASSLERYIRLLPPAAGDSPAPAEPASAFSAGQAGDAAARIEQVISAGMKYLGTPYEYGSSRSDTATFDCSDLVRQIFKEAASLTLPADSRAQGAWILSDSKAVSEIGGLKRGDLMFFMSYRGNSASAYAGIDKSAAVITHVAVYLGNGQMLHTYSKASGGVRVDTISASWTYRFLYGGSVIH